MIIKNWMKKNPIIVGSDVLISEAKLLFTKHKMTFIPVVDDGKLRGILSRKDMREAATSVTGTQNIHEMDYFNNRLKVKDLMVRKPVTLNPEDTVETALIRGKTFGESYFPIIAGQKLVGAISNREISKSFNEILGVDEKLAGVALDIDEPYGQAIKNIVKDIFSAEMELQGFFTLRDPETDKKRLLLRFEQQFFDRIMAIIKEKGYRIIETS